MSIKGHAIISGTCSFIRDWSWSWSWPICEAVLCCWVDVGGCYRPSSAPACALPTLSELLAPHISSELLNPPSPVQLQLYASVFQIVQALTRLIAKYLENGTLIDAILTNRSDRYTSRDFCQGLSEHCGVACVCKCVNLRSPPLIT